MVGLTLEKAMDGDFYCWIWTMSYINLSYKTSLKYLLYFLARPIFFQTSWETCRCKYGNIINIMWIILKSELL